MRSIPRSRFAHLPTPVEELPQITKFFAGPRLLVKRDDQTGLALGGNKTRKLEFLIADAKKHDAGTLITAGAAQSNHCRQTAAADHRAQYVPGSEVPVGGVAYARIAEARIIV